MKEPSVSFPLEDVEALPEILEALHRANRIDLVTTWLAEHGITDRSTIGIDAIRLALDPILKARRGEARLTADCIALAIGMYREDGRSISDIARDWGITRQSAHARVRRICRTLRIPATDCSKRFDAGDTYKITNFRHPAQQLEEAA